MIKVGVTGGIGSGKSIVCQVFECMGVPVYYADPAARQLIDSHQDIRNELIALLGNDIYNEKGLNRILFASRIFRNEQLLAKVNAVIHPRVREDFIAWSEKNNQHTYVIEEAAILFESGANKLMDKCIVVVSPIEMRLSRLLRRAGMTTERAVEIMKNQWSDDRKIHLSDYVIYNDEKNLILPQILQIHRELSAF